MELPDLSEVLLRALLDEPITEEDHRSEHGFALLHVLYLSPGDVCPLWVEHRHELIRAWVADRPGTRPQMWWHHDAPRQLIDSLCELPRERLGGVGTPEHEVMNVSPSFWLGIPSAWVTAEDVAYYTGTARDIHGELINPAAADDPEPFLGVAIDPDDPPRYEAQATYLRRYHLFLRGEERRLGPADYQPEEVQP